MMTSHPPVSAHWFSSRPKQGHRSRSGHAAKCEPVGKPHLRWLLPVCSWHHRIAKHSKTKYWVSDLSRITYPKVVSIMRGLWGKLYHNRIKAQFISIYQQIEVWPCGCASCGYQRVNLVRWYSKRFPLLFGHFFFPQTSSTAQGGGGSFKNRKPIGEIGCCESGMAERSDWWTERCLRSPLFLSLSLAIYLPTYRSIYVSIYLSLSFI